MTTVRVDDNLIQAAIAHSAGTPVLIMDTATLKATAAVFAAYAPALATYYAVKANADPAVLRVLAAEGIGFEVASKLGGRNASRHLRQWLAPYMCSGNHGGCRCRCSPARDGLRANFSSPWVCRITTGLLLSRKDICDLDNSCFSYFLKYFLNIDIGPIAFFFCNISVRFTLLCRISMIITTNYYSKGLALEDINCDLPACYRHRRRHNRRRYFSFLASL